MSLDKSMVEGVIARFGRLNAALNKAGTERFHHLRRLHRKQNAAARSRST
jgi:hypothetical protein